MRPRLWGPCCLFRMWQAELPEITAANNGAVWLSLSPGHRKWVALSPVIRCLLGHGRVAQMGGEVPIRGLNLPPLVSSFRTMYILKGLGEGVGRAHIRCGKWTCARHKGLGHVLYPNVKVLLVTFRHQAWVLGRHLGVMGCSASGPEQSAALRAAHDTQEGWNP